MDGRAIRELVDGLEMDTDRAGSDYLSFHYDTPSRCRAWTYAPPNNTPRATCWLKNAIPGASSVKGLVSGVKWQKWQEFS